MILKRIANGIKEQDWFVVSVEIMIVVVGIFIGLQVDDWNDARKDRQEEKLIIATIQEDIQTALPPQVNNFERVRQELADLKDAIFIIQDDDGGSWTLNHCRAVWRSHIVDGFHPLAIISIEELMSSNKFNIITSNELKNALLNLQANTKLGSDLRTFIENDIANLVDNYPDILPRRMSRDEEYIVDCDFEGIRTNQSVRNKILSNFARREALVGFIETRVEALRDLERIITSLGDTR